MVACLKRLLPVGLNLFAGREQEMVQHAKDRYLKVGCDCCNTLTLCINYLKPASTISGVTNS